MIPTLVMSQNREVSLKRTFQLLALFVLIIGALRVLPTASFLFVALALAFAQGKHVDYVFFLILLLSGLNVSNNLFFPKTYAYIAGNRLTMLTLFVLLLSKNARAQAKLFFRPFHWLIAYVVYMMVVSLYGWMPIISELKAILFLLFVMTYIQGTRLVADQMIDVVRLRAAVLAVAVFYIIGSIAVMPFPEIGQSMLRNRVPGREVEGLFNGVTNHSQMLGPVVAMLNAVVLSDVLFNLRRQSWLHLVLLLGVPLIVYKTGSRTALLAYIASLFAPVFFVTHAKGVLARTRSKVLVVSGVVLLAVGAAVIRSPALRTELEVFLRKAGSAEKLKDDQSLKEALTASRVGPMEQAMANFRERPLIGNGFQVSKNMQGMPISDFRDLLSAPIEKGIAWVMVLEEGGIIGAIIFGGFCLAFYATYWRMRCYCLLAAFTTMLALNTGEALLFSTTAGGGVAWVLCFYSLLLDIARMQASSQQHGLQALLQTDQLEGLAVEPA